MTSLLLLNDLHEIWMVNEDLCKILELLSGFLLRLSRLNNFHFKHLVTIIQKRNSCANAKNSTAALQSENDLCLTIRSPWWHPNTKASPEFIALLDFSPGNARITCEKWSSGTRGIPAEIFCYRKRWPSIIQTETSSARRRVPQVRQKENFTGPLCVSATNCIVEFRSRLRG